MRENYVNGWLLAINKSYDANSSNKLKTYASFKTEFQMEKYVSAHKISKRFNFSKLRISDHHLAIETDRYKRPMPPRELRFCTNCTLNVVGDEQHFLLNCAQFSQERKELFDHLEKTFGITNNNDDYTFRTLMNYDYGHSEFSTQICKFINSCSHAI